MLLLNTSQPLPVHLSPFEMLQTGFLNKARGNLEERDTIIELSAKIEEQELLLEFLLLIQRRKQENAAKLEEAVSFLSSDIEEVVNQQGIMKNCGASFLEPGKGSHSASDLHFINIVKSVDAATSRCGKYFRPILAEEWGDNLDKGRKSDTFSGSQESVLTRNSMLMNNFKKLELAYFMRRLSKPLQNPFSRYSQTSSDSRGSAVITERSSAKNLVTKEQHSESRKSDSTNPFHEGLCKYLSYSKFIVKADLKQGDLLNSSNLVCSLGFDRDGEFFATAGVNKKIKIFEFDAILNEDSEIHYPLVEMAGRSKLSSICWNSYIKSHIASSNFEGAVQVWDVTRGQVLTEMREHERRVWSVDFSSANPTLLASGSDDGSIKLWSINQGASVSTIHTKANACCVQFPLGSARTLAFGSADHNIYYYDLRNSKRPLCTLVGHKKTVSFVKFVNSTNLVSASTDNTLKLWDLSLHASCVLDGPLSSFTGHLNVKVFVYHKAFPMPSLSFKFETKHPLSGHEVDDARQFISSVCWRGRSTTLVAASSSGNIKILEMV